MTTADGHGEGSLLLLALLALIAGAVAGLVGAIFRICLEQADGLRDVLIARAQGWEVVGFLLVLAACAAATALAAWLVRRTPWGSGIPHVEAVLRGELPQAPFRLTQSVLAGSVSLAAIPAVFLIRFALGAVSYAAGTPGGLFARMLVLGAQFGFLFGGVCRTLLTYLDVQPEGFAIVGMAAFFAGVVREIGRASFSE